MKQRRTRQPKKDAQKTNPVGRPSAYRPDFCAKVIELGRQGKSRCQIAGILDVSFKTLQEYEEKHPEFLQSTQRAKDLAQMWWEEQGQRGIWAGSDFNANAYRLQVTNRFPDQWRDKQQLEHTGKDGSPLEANSASVGDLLKAAELMGLQIPQVVAIKK